MKSYRFWPAYKLDSLEILVLKNILPSEGDVLMILLKDVSHSHGLLPTFAPLLDF